MGGFSNTCCLCFLAGRILEKSAADAFPGFETPDPTSSLRLTGSRLQRPDILAHSRMWHNLIMISVSRQRTKWRFGQCVHEREVNSSQFMRLKIELPFSLDYDKIVGYPRETGRQVECSQVINVCIARLLPSSLCLFRTGRWNPVFWICCMTA